MVWLILLIVVVFLVASAMPLIREIAYEKTERKLIPPTQGVEHIEEIAQEADHEDGKRTP